MKDQRPESHPFHCCGDVWHLVNSSEECSVYEKLHEHETTLKAMAPEGQEPFDQNTDAGLHLDQVIAETVGKSTRKCPIKGATMENVMNMFGFKQGQGDSGNSSKSNHIIY